MTLSAVKNLCVIIAMLGSTALLSGCGPDQAAPPDAIIPLPDCNVGSTANQSMCSMTGANMRSIFNSVITDLVPISMLNFNDFYVDLAGSTVIFPTNGSFTIALKNASGQTMAASSFAWTKQGNTLIANSPTAIQNWVIATNGGFNVVDVTIDPTSINVQSGINAIMLTSRFGSEVLATAGTVWMVSNCNTGPQQGTMNCL